MERIALVYHKSGIPGGHCEYSEVLMRGLRENGADAEFFYISPVQQDNISRVRSKHSELYKLGGVDDKGKRYSWGPTLGCYYHSETGFVLKEHGYGNRVLAEQLRKKLDEFDVVIWQDIGGFKNPHNEENTDWLKLVKRRPGQKQVVMFHDHGALLRYPWVTKIEDEFDFMVCVHPASYNMGANFRLPRCMILNPQVLDKPVVSNWGNRDKQTLMAIGAWKGSKKMHELVMATPWIKRDAVISMCGDGTERRYLAATDKCKDAYIRTRNTDPGVSPDVLTGIREQDRFWVHAHNHPGFKWWGPVDSATRDQLYYDCFMFVDPAWYSVNKKIDAHFSRVIVEAMKNGIVPFARDLGLGTGGGKGSMFQAGKHYINIPWDATPKQFGEIVNNTLDTITQEQYNEIVENNKVLVQATDHKKVTEQLLLAINGTDQPGFYGKWETGADNPAFVDAGHKQWTGQVKGFCFHE